MASSELLVTAQLVRLASLRDGQVDRARVKRLLLLGDAPTLSAFQGTAGKA